MAPTEKKDDEKTQATAVKLTDEEKVISKQTVEKSRMPVWDLGGTPGDELEALHEEHDWVLSHTAKAKKEYEEEKNKTKKLAAKKRELEKANEEAQIRAKNLKTMR